MSSENPSFTALSCLYGENPWQKLARLLTFNTGDPLAIDKFRVVEGKDPSYNNIVDVERLLQTVTHIAAAFEENGLKVPTIAVGVKHGNACGASVGTVRNNLTNRAVLDQMMSGDKEAVFGGLVMTNFYLGADEAEHLSAKKLDGVIAPELSPEAIERLRRKGNKCRFMVNPALGSLDIRSLDKAERFRYVRGGKLVQPNYTYVLDMEHDVTCYGPKITAEQLEDALLACAIGSTSNSNTITLVKNGQLIANGVGQQSRVVAAEVALLRADLSGHNMGDSVAYSDSFFPFPDGPEILINAGVKVILTSSGSINDQQTIDLCQKRGVSLLMVPDKLGRGFFGH